MKTADTYLTWTGAQEYFSGKFKEYHSQLFYSTELFYAQLGGSLYNLGIIKDNNRFIEEDMPLKQVIYDYAKEVTRKSFT